MQAQRTRNCPGTRQSLVWVSPEASPFSEEESSDPEKDSYPFPSPEQEHSSPVTITGVPTTRFCVVCTTPPCREEHGHVVLDSFPSVEEHQQEHHPDSGRSATEFYRAFRSLVAPHQRYGSLAPPKRKRSKNTANDDYCLRGVAAPDSEGDDPMLGTWHEQEDASRVVVKPATEAPLPAPREDLDFAVVQKYLDVATSSVADCPLTVLWQVQLLLQLDAEPTPQYFLSREDECSFALGMIDGEVSLEAFGTAFVSFAYRRLLSTASSPGERDLALRLSAAEVSDATKIDAVHRLLINALQPELQREPVAQSALTAHPFLRDFICWHVQPSLRGDTLKWLHMLLKFCALVVILAAAVSPLAEVELRWHDKALLAELARVRHLCQRDSIVIRA